MEFSPHFTRTEVFSPILSKNVVPILPYFDTYIKKYIFINLTSFDSQKGPEPLTFNWQSIYKRVLQTFFKTKLI